MSLAWQPAQDPALGTVYTPASQVGPVVCRPADVNDLSQIVARLHRADRQWTRIYRETEQVLSGCTVVAVSMAQLDQIGPVDGRSKVVVVQTGATWGAVQSLLDEEALTLGPVPGWLWDRAVGESIDAHDLLRPSPAYGQLTDCLLAVETVLPTGETTRSSVSPRRATGPDFARTVVGAQGRAGLAHEVRLRVWSKPGVCSFHGAEFSSWSAAHDRCQALLLAGVRPAWWRLSRHGRLTRLLARIDVPEWAERFATMTTGSPALCAMAQQLEQRSFGPQPAPEALYRRRSARRSEIGRVAGRDKGAVAWEIRRDGVAFYGPEPLAAPKGAEHAGWAALLATFTQTLSGELTR